MALTSYMSFFTNAMLTCAESCKFLKNNVNNHNNLLNLAPAFSITYTLLLLHFLKKHNSSCVCMTQCDSSTLMVELIVVNGCT